MAKPTPLSIALVFAFFAYWIWTGLTHSHFAGFMYEQQLLIDQRHFRSITWLGSLFAIAGVVLIGVTVWGAISNAKRRVELPADLANEATRKRRRVLAPAVPVAIASGVVVVLLVVRPELARDLLGRWSLLSLPMCSVATYFVLEHALPAQYVDGEVTNKGMRTALDPKDPMWFVEVGGREHSVPQALYDSLELGQRLGIASSASGAFFLAVGEPATATGPYR